MRIANHDGRTVLLLSDTQGADVAIASDSRFGPDPQSVYTHWREFVDWATGVELVPDVDIDPSLLGSPSPSPSQVVAIGLNYADHATETGFAAPTTLPPVFTKFASSITGPYGEIDLPADGSTDWEVEVVAVIGRVAHHVRVDDAWAYVAGLSVGQDLSERVRQMSGPVPQFGLAKSFPGFSPIGPWLVTPDEFDNPDSLQLGCALSTDRGWETLQEGRTSNLIFSIPRTISALSEVITLRPGDVIFTGTPDGVGMGRKPPRYLQPGDTLRSWVVGVGELQQTFR